MARDDAAEIDAAEIREILTSLARPRMTGSAGAREVATELRDRFGALGYQTREMAFSFSTLPGRYGLPVAGVVLLATALSAAWLLTGGRWAPALAVLCAGLALATLPLLFLATLLRSLPWGRVETANLLFTRETPRWIIMAHRDTKSQWAPTLVRTGALVLAVLAWATLAALAVASLPHGIGAPAGLVGAGAGALGMAGAVLAGSPSQNASPGALDNGTGLAALLALAARVPPDVAFLVTDGEELGLAGARAAVDDLPNVAGIINLDGLDDVGPVRIVEARVGRRRAAVDAVAGALLEDARALGIEAVRRPLPPFVLVDHEPLAAAGRPALTLLKGRWRSLLRTHRPSDTADRLTGAGAATVAELVLTALGGLATEINHTLRPDERSGHSPPL
ncbi:MAG: M28 family peptidase [Longimicrobiales bacterium]